MGKSFLVGLWWSIIARDGCQVGVNGLWSEAAVLGSPGGDDDALLNKELK